VLADLASATGPEMNLRGQGEIPIARHGISLGEEREDGTLNHCLVPTDQ